MEKEIRSLEAVINRLHEAKEKYCITSCALRRLCSSAKEFLVKDLPKNLNNITLANGTVELKRFKGYDAGMYRDFWFITLNHEIVHDQWWHDVRKGSYVPSRELMIEFLKIFPDLVLELSKKLEQLSIENETIANSVRV